MDKTRIRLIQQASGWAALGLLYGCDAFSDPTLAPTSHASSVKPVETNRVLQPIGGDGLPRALVFRMQAENKYGLVLVLPKDSEQRKALGTTLEEAMLMTESPLASLRWWPSSTDFLWLATLSEFVVSCVPEWSSEVSSGARALIVTPDALIISATDLHLENPQAFVHEIRALCAQEPGASMRAAGVDPEALRRLEHYLETGDLALSEREASEGAEADDVLQSLVAECLPAMSQRLMNEADETVEKLRFVFWPQRFDGLTEQQESATVVHGVKWNYEAYDACPLCGMSYTPAEKRVFDHFVDE